MAMSIQQIARMLQQRGSPMAGETAAIAREAQRAGVPLGYVLGVAGKESEFGKTGYARGRHNPFGYGIYKGYDYPTYAAATRAMLSGIKSKTYRGQQTPRGIAEIYAPSSDGNNPAGYADDVSSIARMFGYDIGPTSDVIGASDSSYTGPANTPRSDNSTGLAAGQAKSQVIQALAGMNSKDTLTRIASLLQLRDYKQGGAQDTTGTTDGGGGGAGGGAMLSGAILGSPVPGQKPHAATHETSGLSGYPAYDYMTAAGTPAVAPATGRILRLSGKDPSLGGSPGGPLGYSIYLQGGGRNYFLTHLDKLRVKAGQRVRQGQQIAQVAAGPASWSSPHVHMGVSG